METERAPNPWMSIWTAPRNTMQQLLDTDPSRHVWTIAALSGVARFLTTAGRQDLGERYGVLAIVLGAAVIGPVMGVVGVGLTAFFVRWTGRWIGGQGDAAAVRAAVAWSQVPFVCGLAIWPPTVLALGSDVFRSGPPDIDGIAPLVAIHMSFVATRMLLQIWSLGLLFPCIAQAHGFSILRALANVAITTVVMLVALFGLVFVAAALGEVF